MNAAAAAAALGHPQHIGPRTWRADCPVHGGHSLELTDGRDGRLLVYCFGENCDRVEILRRLRHRGLSNGSNDHYAPAPDRRDAEDEADAKAEIERLRRRIAAARDLYRHSKHATGTPVETYLCSRGITGPISPVLRWVQHCQHRNGGYYPAMVAPIVNVLGEQIGVHKTFLRPDGAGKADLPKEEPRETCGPMKGGAVRLAPHCAGVALLVGEGIETTLSAVQLFGLPGWAALCDTGIKALELPPEARSIVIVADNDVSGAGQRAALSAEERWTAERRSVRILLPPNVGEDFNDVLLSAE